MKKLDRILQTCIFFQRASFQRVFGVFFFFFYFARNEIMKKLFVRVEIKILSGVARSFFSVFIFGSMKKYIARRGKIVFESKQKWKKYSF